MTIQKAIKSGLPFRRPSWLIYAAFDIESETEFKYVALYVGKDHFLLGDDVYFDRDDLLAKDWEVKK